MSDHQAMALELSTATAEYVKIPVAGRIAGVPVDLSGDQVEACLVLAGATPTEPDWQTAGWETTAGSVPRYLARLLVANPTAGQYTAWVRVHHGPESMVRPAPGLVIVT